MARRRSIGALGREARASDVRVLAGHCYDHRSTPPYGPWIGLIGDFETDDSSPVPPPILSDETARSSVDSQDALFADVSGFLSRLAAQRPLVIILEDLHWSDPASLDLLRFLVRRLNREPILIVGSYRDDDLTRGHPLSGALPTLVREGSAFLTTLRRLQPASTRAIVGRLYHLPTVDEGLLSTYLQRLSEGNPFYIHELLQDFEETSVLVRSEAGWVLGDLPQAQVPSLIQHVIDARLSRLSDSTRRMLEIGAVIGQEIPLDLWSAVSDETSDSMISAVAEATGAHVLYESADGRGLRFSHSLVREAVYSRVVLPLRQVLHRRIAEWLEAQPRAEPYDVSYHYARADDPRAINWLVGAGGRARLQHAPQAAIEMLSGAESLAQRHNLELPLAARRERALAFDTIGNFDAARTDLEAVLQFARSRGDWQAEWQALVDLGQLWSSRDYAKTGDLFQRALEIARAAGDDSVIAYSLNRIGNWHLNVERPADAFRLHQEALSLFERLDDREGVAATTDHLGLASYFTGDLVGGTDYFRRAVELFREADNRLAIASSLTVMTMRGVTYQTDTMIVDRATPLECAADGEAALEISREIGWQIWRVFRAVDAGFHACRWRSLPPSAGRGKSRG